MRRHMVELSTGPLAYVTQGVGRALVYLHPMGGLRWTKVQDMLARSRALVAPVMPGFDGTSHHPDITTGEGIGLLVGEFIDRVIGAPVARVDVHGHSFGGWCALWLAATRPDRVDRLVLEAPAGLRPSDAPPPPADPAERKRALFRYPGNLTDDVARVAFEAANEANRARYGLPSTTDPALLPRLAGIGAMTLIIAGADDRITPKEGMELARANLARSALRYVPDAAHGISVDQPDRLIRLVECFLGGAEAFPAGHEGGVAADGQAVDRAQP